MSAREAVALAKQPGRWPDGGNLYLDVDADDKGEVTRRRWLFFFASGGKRCEMGLGPYPAVGLADARAARDDA